MSSQKDDWKQKYRELAMEVEETQSRAEHNEQLLKQVINSMTLALEGESVELDAELTGLKTSLTHEDSKLLGRTSKRLDKQIRLRDETREAQTKKTLEAVRRWIRMLRVSTDHSPMASVLDACEQRSEQILTAASELPSLLTDLVELQSGVNNSTGSADGVPAVESEPAAVATGVEPEEQMRLLQAVSSELITLITGLNLDGQEADQARQLQQQIDHGITLADLPPLLRHVIQLVGKSNATGSEEFEKYLLDLSSQLTEVESFIQESRTEQESLGASQRKLDSQVRNNVAQLSETVKSTHDLGELKRAVAGQLHHVVRAMDAFKRDEDEREQRLKVRYDDLQSKVEQMEKESREVRAHMEAEKLRATTDALTGLPNRAAYDERINDEVARWKRYQTGFAVVVGDLDFFKRINDTYGHLAGDKVLRLISKVIKLKLRNTDFIARYGGEEFVILMPSTTAEEAHRAVDKIRQAVAKSPFNFHGKPVTVTMSFGVTETRDGDDGESLFSRADAMLYKAKESGRNRAVIG